MLQRIITTTTNAETRDRTGDLQIFGLTLSQLGYRGHCDKWHACNRQTRAEKCRCNTRTQRRCYLTKPRCHNIIGFHTVRILEHTLKGSLDHAIVDAKARWAWHRKTRSYADLNRDRWIQSPEYQPLHHRTNRTEQCCLCRLPGPMSLQPAWRVG